MICYGICIYLIRVTFCAAQPYLGQSQRSIQLRPSGKGGDDKTAPVFRGGHFPCAVQSRRNAVVPAKQPQPISSSGESSSGHGLHTACTAKAVTSRISLEEGVLLLLVVLNKERKTGRGSVCVCVCVLVISISPSCKDNKETGKCNLGIVCCFS